MRVVLRFFCYNGPGEGEIGPIGSYIHWISENEDILQVRYCVLFTMENDIKPDILNLRSLWILFHNEPIDGW